MNSLHSVIRVHRWQLDEKRRALADLESLAERLSLELRRLDEDVERERAAVGQGSGSTADFANYLKAVQLRREHLIESREQVERQIAAASKDIAESYRDLKKYEIAQSDRERNAQLRRRRRETVMYDEIAVTGHNRRGAAESEG